MVSRQWKLRDLSTGMVECILRPNRHALKRIRMRAGLTQEQMAARMAMPYLTLANKERGINPVNKCNMRLAQMVTDNKIGS